MRCTPHRLLLASVLPAWIAAAEARGQGDTAWRAHDRAARAAYERRDFISYREQLARLAAALPGHPRVLYKLAGAEALLGRSDSALRRLRTFAATGLVADLAADSDFATLRGHDGFRDVAARIERNRRPVSTGIRAFSFPDSQLHPEDVTYDRATRTFFMSSMKRRKIVRFGLDGAPSDFTPEGQDGLWSILAVAVDHRNRLLWATTSVIAQMGPFAASDSGRAALLAYDLATGRPVARHELSGRDGPHELGELAVDARGDVFVADGRRGELYVLRRGSTALEKLVRAGVMMSPQGIVVRPDGRLFVADYALGIAIVDPSDGHVRWVAHSDSVALTGIDGLAMHDRTLLAVQNGTTPRRIARLTLAGADLDRVARLDVLEANTRVLSEPTHGVVVDGAFYVIANSGFDRLAPDGSLRPGAVLEPPVVLRLPLAARRVRPGSSSPAAPGTAAARAAVRAGTSP